MRAAVIAAVEPVAVVRLGSAVMWCARCGEDVVAGDERCPFCGCRELVDPRAVLRAEEFALVR